MTEAGSVEFDDITGGITDDVSAAAPDETPPPPADGGAPVWGIAQDCADVDSLMEECASCILACYDDVTGQVDALLNECGAECDIACRCVTGSLQLSLDELARMVLGAEAQVTKQVDKLINQLIASVSEAEQMLPPPPLSAPQPAMGGGAAFPEPAPNGNQQTCPPGSTYGLISTDPMSYGCVQDPDPCYAWLISAGGCHTARPGETVDIGGGEIFTLPDWNPDPRFPQQYWITGPNCGATENMWMVQGLTAGDTVTDQCGNVWRNWYQFIPEPDQGGDTTPGGCGEPAVCEPVSLVRCIEPDPGPTTLDKENYSAFWAVLAYPITGVWPKTQQ